MFAGNGATMSVTYGATPSVPTSTSLLPCGSACGSGGASALTNTLTPTLYATSVDPNGATVQLNFQVWAGTQHDADERRRERIERIWALRSG